MRLLSRKQPGKHRKEEFDRLLGRLHWGSKIRIRKQLIRKERIDIG